MINFRVQSRLIKIIGRVSGADKFLKDAIDELREDADKLNDSFVGCPDDTNHNAHAEVMWSRCHSRGTPFSYYFARRELREEYEKLWKNIEFMTRYCIFAVDFV